MVFIQFIRYKLIDDSKLSEFLESKKIVLESFVKLQKGFICWESCCDDKQNTRSDILHWESLQDFENSQKLFLENESCKKMMSFISSGSIETLDFNSVHTWNRF